MDANIKQKVVMCNNDKTKRLNEAYRYLYGVGLVKNKTDFSNKIGYGRANTSSALNGDKRYLTDSFLGLISSQFRQINLDWLLTGEGDMLAEKSPFEISNEDEYQKAIASGLSLIPEHSIAFRGGNIGESISKDDIVGYWHIPDAKGKDIITIEGDSMAPVYPSGTKILIRSFGFSVDNPTSIPFGNPFAIEIEDELTGERIGYVKYLRRHKDPELAKKYWVAHSADREHFDDFDIPIAQVRGLWIVEYSIKKVF